MITTPRTLARSAAQSPRLTVLIGALAVASALMATAIVASVTNGDTLRWISIFGLVAAISTAGLALWTPDLRQDDHREKIGLAVLAASLFFGLGSFMALQNERVAAQGSLESSQAERGFELAAEKRQLILELGLKKDLRGIDLRRRDVSGVSLRRRQFAGALLDAVDLRRSDLRGSNLRAAKLSGARLGFANLRNADLRGATLERARLGRSDIRGADLRGVVGLRTARLTGALADGDTRWPDARFSPGRAGVVCVDGRCGKAP